MNHKDLTKLVELEGQIFDELIKQGKSEEALVVIKRQLDILDKGLKVKKKST